MYSPSRKAKSKSTERDSASPPPSVQSEQSSEDSDFPYVNGEKIPEYFKIVQINEKLYSLCQTIKDKLPEVVPDTVYEITQWINFPVQVVFSGIHNGGNDYGEYYMSTRSIGEFVLYLLNANMNVKTNITTTIVRKFKALNPETYQYGLLVKTIGQKPEKTYTVQSIPMQSEQVSAAGKGRGSHQNSRGTSYYWPFAYIPKIINPLLFTISKSKAFKDIQYFGPPVLSLNHSLSDDQPIGEWNSGNYGRGGGTTIAPLTAAAAARGLGAAMIKGSGGAGVKEDHHRGGGGGGAGRGSKSSSEQYGGYHDEPPHGAYAHPSDVHGGYGSGYHPPGVHSPGGGAYSSSSKGAHHPPNPSTLPRAASPSSAAGAANLLYAASPDKRKMPQNDKEYELIASIESKKKRIEDYNNELVGLVFEVAQEEQELRRLQEYAGNGPSGKVTRGSIAEASS
eukprot:Nk52_evm14s246 gene=Nk52_evmTU14s246